MSTVAQADTILLVIALIIGLAVGFWMFRRRERRSSIESHHPEPAPIAQPVVPTAVDDSEGNSIPDGIAMATLDVAGEILGVETHAPIAAESGPPDNLQTLKGVGPKLASELNANGITRFDQLAALGDEDITRLDAKLGAFSGRLRRDRIVEQASYLARNDTAGFEENFGKLGSASRA